MKFFKLFSCIALIGLSLSSSAAEISVAQTQLQAPAQTNHIIAYFSARQNGKTTHINTADPQGIYRVLISKSSEGYLVQDFFQANHQAQSSPVLLTDAEDLDRFQVQSAVGEILLYNRNGQRFNKQVYDKDHDVIYVAGYSLHGQILLEQEVNPEDGITHTKLWHSNGTLAFELQSNSDMQLIDSQAWRRNGKAFNSKTCFNDRSLDFSSAAIDPCVLQLKSLYQKYEKLWETQMQ